MHWPLGVQWVGATELAKKTQRVARNAYAFFSDPTATPPPKPQSNFDAPLPFRVRFVFPRGQELEALFFSMLRQHVR